MCVIEYQEYYAENRFPSTLLVHAPKNIFRPSEVLSKAQVLAKKPGIDLDLENFDLANTNKDAFKVFVEKLEETIGPGPATVIILAICNDITDLDTIASYLSVLWMAVVHSNRALQNPQHKGLQVAEIVFKALNGFGRNGAEKYANNDYASNRLPDFLDKIISFYADGTDACGQCRSLSLVPKLAMSALGFTGAGVTFMETIDEKNEAQQHAMFEYENKSYESTNPDPYIRGALFNNKFREIKADSPLDFLNHDLAKQLEITLNNVNQNAETIGNLIKKINKLENVHQDDKKHSYALDCLISAYSFLANKAYLDKNYEECLNHIKKIKTYHNELLAIFNPIKDKLPQRITNILADQEKLLRPFFEFYESHRASLSE